MLDRGEVTGDVSLTATDELTWSGTELKSARLVRNEGQGQMTGGPTFRLSDTTFENTGTLRWEEGKLEGKRGAILRNNANATLKISSERGMEGDASESSDPPLILENKGQLTLDSPDGPRYVLENTRVVNESGANMALTVGGLRLRGGAGRLLNKGQLDLTLPGDGRVELDRPVTNKGTIALETGELEVNENFKLSGKLTAEADSKVIARSSSLLDIDGGTFLNRGIFAWRDGRVRGGHGGVLSNTEGATIEVRHHKRLSGDHYGAEDPLVLKNAGTVTKTDRLEDANWYVCWKDLGGSGLTSSDDPNDSREIIVHDLCDDT